MASENNPVSSRQDYFASFIFLCYQNTKTDFEEEKLELILQAEYVPLSLQKKNEKVKKNKQTNKTTKEIHTNRRKQSKQSTPPQIKMLIMSPGSVPAQC